MTNTQQKNILLTVVGAIAFMMAVLLLFFNKITTARYLSDVELKINHLVMVKPHKRILPEGEQWLLIAVNDEQQRMLAKFLMSLDTRFQKKTAIVKLDDLDDKAQSLNISKEVIGIIHPNGQLFAYFKPPFDQHKMTLTYASVFTHR